MNLYLYEDSLFVYSLKSYNLYAFKAESAALFLMLDGKLKSDYPVDKTSPLVKFVEKIISAKDRSSHEDRSFEKFQNRGVVSSKNRKYKFYKLDNWLFYLDIDDVLVKNHVEKLFTHLISKPLSGEKVSRITVKITNLMYKIYINGVLAKEVEGLEQLVPMVLAHVRLAYYTQKNFLIALHAASLEYNNRVLIMPGVSGAGKSTLSAYLTTKGFKIYSDELSVITQEEKILPIPLGIGLKENSWSVISDSLSSLDTLDIHKRYDGQSVKYLLSDNIASENISVKNGVIIFNRYKKGAKAVLTAIDIVETLQILINSQYHLYDLKDANMIEKWLSLLTTCEMYRLEYSALEDAEIIIKEVMHNEKI